MKCKCGMSSEYVRYVCYVVLQIQLTKLYAYHTYILRGGKHAVYVCMQNVTFAYSTFCAQGISRKLVKLTLTISIVMNDSEF